MMCVCVGGGGVEGGGGEREGPERGGGVTQVLNGYRLPHGHAHRAEALNVKIDLLI